MNDQEKLVELLDKAIQALDEATNLERKITHSTHRSSVYETMLSQLKWTRDHERALLKRQQTIGR